MISVYSLPFHFLAVSLEEQKLNVDAVQFISLYFSCSSFLFS